MNPQPPSLGNDVAVTRPRQRFHQEANGSPARTGFCRGRPQDQPQSAAFLDGQLKPPRCDVVQAGKGGEHHRHAFIGKALMDRPNGIALRRRANENGSRRRESPPEGRRGIERARMIHDHHRPSVTAGRGR